MSNTSEPEKFSEHKLHLISALHTVLVTNMNTGPALDDKAWNILRFTSAAFGVAIAIATLNKDTIDGTLFALGLIVALFIHMLQMWFLWKAIQPHEYVMPPGVPSENFSIDDFDSRYYTVTTEDYLFYLVVDYIGTDKLPGAIQMAQAVNAKKTTYLNLMTLCLMATISVLIIASGISIL